MKKNFKVILFYIVLAVLVIVLAAQFFKSNTTKISYNEVIQLIHDEKVAELKIDRHDNVTLKLKDGEKASNGETTVTYELRNYAYFQADIGDEIIAQAEAGTLKVDISSARTAWWVSLIPYAVILIFIVLVYVFMIRSASAQGAGRLNSFGKARVRMPSDKNRVTFADVAGADEEKEELEEIVDFLKDPAKYTALGAKIPHGVLLVGPPGTGKTLLAKAVAGEAGVPFFSISGSDFVEMYVGVGASRVRDLFETARKTPASIVFIDEIDAVGRHRGAGLGGGHDEREQTLNQLLVEMDGFGTHEGIIVMAATNRPDILDPALLRPGRFDRRITVNYPDIRGREEILKVHARHKKFEKEVDFAVIAGTTAGFTGAELANLLNEAALLAARRKKSLIGMADIEDAFLKVLTGPQKKSRRMSEREKRNTAYHEAGHAVVEFYCPTSDPVHTISIIPAGQTLGVTVSLPQQDKYSVFKQELIERISGLLGGRIAEQLIFGDVSGGASNDIQRATQIAREMVAKLGMSEELGPIRYGSSHGDDIFLGRDFSSTQDYSDATAAKIDAEVQRIVNEAYEAAKKILEEHKDKLIFVAEYLVKHEIMDGDQFRAVMEGEPTEEEIVAIGEAKAAKSRQANKEQAQKDEEERAQAEAQRESDDNDYPDDDGNPEA